ALRFKDLDQSEQALVKLRPVAKVFFCEFQKEVTVNLDVQRLTEKTFENVTVQLRNIPPGLDAVSLPPTTNIYVKGGDKILAECVPEDFTVYIDLAKVWKPGNKEKVPAVVETSANVLTAEPDPARFELVVKKKEKTQ
ncbi:MAG TPA: hypothetical protein PKV71_16275, partial [Calditrichia bacterium]|nr:hypothetical protein [Calditrichia bacterium]